MGDSVIIDGSHGEGGGQILRTALTLSAITGRPLTIARLRAGRPKPGLAAQHLSGAVRSRALPDGGLGRSARVENPLVPPHGPTTSRQLPLRCRCSPRRGSAGAATLVLQTVALVALFARGASRFCIRGGARGPLRSVSGRAIAANLPLQIQVMRNLAAGLRPGGYLVIGAHEALLAGIVGFQPLPDCRGILQWHACPALFGHTG